MFLSYLSIKQEHLAAAGYNLVHHHISLTLECTNLNKTSTYTEVLFYLITIFIFLVNEYCN